MNDEQKFASTSNKTQ